MTTDTQPDDWVYPCFDGFRVTNGVSCAWRSQFRAKVIGVTEWGLVVQNYHNAPLYLIRSWVRAKSLVP